MMQIPPHYKGREQAYIKHKLLETYLYKLFMILGQHVQTISYVDCFAGPWQDNADDLSDTSIGISLQTMSKCVSSLQKLNPSIRFRALFIEKDPKAFTQAKPFHQHNRK